MSTICPGFDPDFDDTAWTDDWRRVPVTLPPPARHPSGYRLERRWLRDVEVFGHRYHLANPFDCRILYDPAGRLWMSNTPQEHVMMHNNARLTRGRVLVGGLGLGLYPQYAQRGVVGDGTSFTVVERSSIVVDLVGPAVCAALTVPFVVEVSDLALYLAGRGVSTYDTIFLDTWDTLDAASLPVINQLRDLAARHLEPGGRVLLWGYRWIIRLFEDACREILALPPEERRELLLDGERVSEAAARLLTPVLDRFDGQAVDDWDAALVWCRSYAATV